MSDQTPDIKATHGSISGPHLSAYVDSMPVSAPAGPTMFHGEDPIALSSVVSQKVSQAHRTGTRVGVWATPRTLPRFLPRSQFVGLQRGQNSTQSQSQSTARATPWQPAVLLASWRVWLCGAECRPVSYAAHSCCQGRSIQERSALPSRERAALRWPEPPPLASSRRV